MAGASVDLCLDSNAVIGLVETRAGGFARLVALSASGLIRLHVSELVLAEVLVKPLKSHNSVLISLYEEMLSPGGAIRAIAVTRPILIESARNRAEFGNKGVDAIHIATASDAACTVFVSDDRRVHLPAGMERWRLDETLAWAASR